MNNPHTPQPGEASLAALVARFRKAGWLDAESLDLVLATGISLRLSPKGVERLKTLYAVLVEELGEPSADEYDALVQLLLYAAKKHRPPGS